MGKYTHWIDFPVRAVHAKETPLDKLNNLCLLFLSFPFIVYAVVYGHADGSLHSKSIRLCASAVLSSSCVALEAKSWTKRLEWNSCC